MDRITLKGIRIYGFHGVYPIERKSGRYFEIDAELYLPLDYAAAGDDLRQSVDYAQVFDFIKGKFNEEVCSLIETVAIRIAEGILLKFPVEKVIISVRKPAPPVDGHMDYAEVRVERSRR